MALTIRDLTVTKFHSNLYPSCAITRAQSRNTSDISIADTVHMPAWHMKVSGLDIWDFPKHIGSFLNTSFGQK